MRLGQEFLDFFTALAATEVFDAGVGVDSGRPHFQTPLLWIVGFIVFFIVGGLSGITVAAIPFDQQVNASYYIVAHFHFVIFGAAVFPILGGLYYWFPKVTGRMYHEGAGKASFWLSFLGTWLTFFPMHIAGIEGMPRRIYTYQPDLPWHGLNLFVSASAAVLAAGFIVFFIDVFVSARSGNPAGDNPWDAPTLEWATSSPPPAYNFAHIPVVGSANPLWEQQGSLDVANGLHTDRREIVITTLTTAEPQARESSPQNSIWPLFAAIATSIMLVWSIFSPWAVVWGSIPVAITLVGWFWPKGTPEDEA